MSSASDEIMSSASDETMSSASDEPIFTGPCIRVFWDVVAFPFPGLEPALIYQNMSSILEKMGFLGKLSIMAYVDKETFPDELRDVYENAGITIIYPRQQGGIHDICRVMFLDIAWWANENIDNPYVPVNLVVFSKLTREQSGYLERLQQWARDNFNVLLATKPEVLSSIERLQVVSFDCLSTRLLYGGN
ncbi:hypothetical protein AALP_AAs62920U000300 [Arabis alpina]|uniref:NYN domain-containing protein n=1 Tax=Arabis alpina TaxID=50452 RepID=A0A087FYM2_ARAAL|nr:hypothetical protein AALP_AAs62920U000300 [Arabis alpina]